LIAVQREKNLDSLAARDAALASGMEQGMEAGYKNLDALLTDQRRTDKRNST
jgi:hypothetical protein